MDHCHGKAPKHKSAIKVDVGPIYGNHEADEKIKSFLHHHHRYAHYEWTGEWFSENGTSFANIYKHDASSSSSSDSE
jgi:hypothetical protein